MRDSASSPPGLTLLGPQRLAPILGAACDAMGIDGPVAVITAGWEERELEDSELVTALGRPGKNLKLHERAERLMVDHPELLDAHRDRRDRRAALRDLYRVRLAHALDAARELLLRQPSQFDLLEPEQNAAMDAVCRLDDHHLDGLLELRNDAFRQKRIFGHPAVAEVREEIETTINACQAIAIAGGHVRILLDVLYLFNLAPLLRRRPIIAWSAGAMVLSDRVVLFHDSPPQGPGDAEIHSPGLDLYRGLVPLPHARRRLQLDDPLRVRLLARRVAPNAALAMDERAMLRFDAGRLIEQRNVRVLQTDGTVVPFTVPEDAAP